MRVFRVERCLPIERSRSRSLAAFRKRKRSLAVEDRVRALMGDFTTAREKRTEQEDPDVNFIGKPGCPISSKS
jgi:hypothetical protein